MTNPKCLAGSVPDTFSARSADLTGSKMRRITRREFITLLGGAAAAWPLAARAQQSERVRRVGILVVQAERDAQVQSNVAMFQRRLAELGWVEDRNTRFEHRYADGDPERMRTNTAEIIRLKPDVILAQNTPMVAVLRQQTTTIPIVFVSVSDPVGDGFVENLARPGGNVTGFANTMSSLGGKWVELLKEAVPGVSQVGYLFNRAVAPGGGAYYLEPLLTAAATLGVKAVQLELKDAGDIDAAIGGFAATGGNGLIGNSDAFINGNRERISAVAIRHRLPTIYANTASAHAGGLLAYGADTPRMWQAAASYVDRILRGERPNDLPRAAARKVPPGDQSQDREGDRGRHTLVPPATRRRGDRMRRRQFITLLGGAAAAWPLAVRAQQAAPIRPLIGLLAPLSAAAASRNIGAFRSALRDLGYVDGRNATLEIRYGDGAPDRMALLVNELVSLNPNVLFTGGKAGALAAHAATHTIPIVIVTPEDPVVSGLANAIARPGGNVTGTWLLGDDALVGKRLELLRFAVPGLSRVGLSPILTTQAIASQLRNCRRRPKPWAWPSMYSRSAT
jgi:ABC-type uncharacterized transport system substrate-binding protein